MRRSGDSGISYNSGMPLTLQEVEHIASLARLELSEVEKNRYREQLSAILDHVAHLQKLDTSSIHNELAVAGSFASASLRADEPHPGLTQAELFKTAAQIEASQFKIPPVFE